MKIVIDTPNSPGTQFNETTDEYIYEMYRYLENKKDCFVETYKDFQNHATYFTTVSYIRNIFPFLKNAGIINDYEFVSKRLFTDLGKAYYLCIDSIKKSESEGEDKGVYQFENIKHEIIRKCIRNIIQNRNVQYGKIFQKVLRHFLTYDRINESEFALLLGVLQNKVTESEYQSIMNDQKREIIFSINVMEKGSTHMKKLTKITCFSYFMGSLKHAGIIKKEGKGDFARICDSKVIEVML